MKFGVLTSDGLLSIFDSSTERLLLQIKIKTDAWKKGTSYFSMDYSPNGTLFLVTNCLERELLVFNSKTFRLMQKWAKQDAFEIESAKWLDNQSILASFSQPGDLFLFKLGKQTPELHISPSGTLQEASIVHFDVSKNGKEIYCVTGSLDKTVMKLELREKTPFVMWERSGEEGNIGEVCLSEDGKMLIEYGDRKRVNLVSTDDGSTLSSFQGFTGYTIKGVLWYPGSHAAFVWTARELVLLGIKQKMGRKVLEKVDELKKSDIGFEWFNGISAFWGDKSKHKRPFLFVGNGMWKKGDLMKIYMQHSIEA